MRVARAPVASGAWRVGMSAALSWLTLHPHSSLKRRAEQMVHNSARRRLASRPAASTTLPASLALAGLTPTVPAQLAGQIQLGDHASGSINAPVQTDLWVLAGTM